jgi:phosphoglycerol geranylgeranyltransferase
VNTGKVSDYIYSKVKSGPIHMTLIDPDKQEPEIAGEIAFESFRCGTSAIMVGGSTGVERHGLDETLRSIKAKVSIPVIGFPSGISGLSPLFDALYFLSMMNSKLPRHITGEQAAGALLTKRYGIEPIGMGYIIIEPGMKVGEVGHADPVRRDEIERAVGYALAAEYFGMKLVYLEAGSGAPSPVPARMIEAVKREISIPLVVGGGIRNSAAAAEAAAAGADVIVTGTVVEKRDGRDNLKSIIRSVARKG